MGSRTKFDPEAEEAESPGPGSAALPPEIRQNNAEALRRVLKMAEKLIQESNDRHSRIIRYYVGIGFVFGMSILSLSIASVFMDEATVWLRTGLMGMIGVLWACVVALFRVKQDRFEARKNKRLAGKAVEFVREYAAHTRADRSPVEEIELQLRLEQLEIESLDRPLNG